MSDRDVSCPSPGSKIGKNNMTETKVIKHYRDERDVREVVASALFHKQDLAKAKVLMPEAVKQAVGTALGHSYSIADQKTLIKAFGTISDYEPDTNIEYVSVIDGTWTPKFQSWTTETPTWILEGSDLLKKGYSLVVTLKKAKGHEIDVVRTDEGTFSVEVRVVANRWRRLQRKDGVRIFGHSAEALAPYLR